MGNSASTPTSRTDSAVLENLHACGLIDLPPRPNSQYEPLIQYPAPIYSPRLNDRDDNLPPRYEDHENAQLDVEQRSVRGREMWCKLLGAVAAIIIGLVIMYVFVIRDGHKPGDEPQRPGQTWNRRAWGVARIIRIRAGLDSEVGAYWWKSENVSHIFS